MATDKKDKDRGAITQRNIERYLTECSDNEVLKVLLVVTCELIWRFYHNRKENRKIKSMHEEEYE